jgi:hypothetical protein
MSAISERIESAYPCRASSCRPISDLESLGRSRWDIRGLTAAAGGRPVRRFQLRVPCGAVRLT